MYVNNIEEWCNGSTLVFGTNSLGSSPSSFTKFKTK